MEKEFLKRISDLEMAIQDYKKGLYSDKEFEETATKLSGKIFFAKATNRFIDELKKEQRDEEIEAERFAERVELDQRRDYEESLS